jgi:hypothetical protein
MTARAALASLLIAACGQPGRAPSAEPRSTVTAELDARLSARAECSSLDGVTAGSGLVRLGRRVVVVQDAAAAVVLLAPETGATERVVLSGRGQAQAKADKPDYEAAVLGADGAIHVLGSGSAPTRRRIARLDPDGEGIARVAVVDGGPLYDAIAAALGSAPNVEGAVALGGRVRLFHRGAGSARSAAFDVPASALDGAAPGRAAATWFDLGRVGRVPLTFTDAVAAGDRMLYLAVAEDTPNAIDDGPIVGAAVGVIAGSRARYARIAGPDGAPAVHKFEGIALDPGGRSGWLVTDPDS